MQNYNAERHWVEVNSRVNYPMKLALRWMEQVQEIEMDYKMLCISYGRKTLPNRIAASWNDHRIPGALDVSL